MPEGVDVAHSQKLGHPIAFGLRKARIIFVGFWILNIDFLMSHIEVTTQNQIGLGFAQFLTFFN